jgi:protein subunit release factor A
MTDSDLLQRLERCFDRGETETLVWWESSSGVTVAAASAAVKVVHVSSGLEGIGEQSRSQVRNKAAALLQLLQKLHDAAAGESG